MQTGAEPVLAAWGITTAGTPVFIALAPDGTESYDAGTTFSPGSGSGTASPAAGDLGRRPVSSAPSKRSSTRGCANAVWCTGPAPSCPKVPVEARGEVKAFWAVFNGFEAAPGDSAIGVARAQEFAPRDQERFRRRSECLERDTYLRCPAEHWHRIRHSNFIERTVGETRRRVKVIGRLPGDRSCISLVCAVLARHAAGAVSLRHPLGCACSKTSAVNSSNRRSSRRWSTTKLWHRPQRVSRTHACRDCHRILDVSNERNPSPRRHQRSAARSSNTLNSRNATAASSIPLKGPGEWTGTGGPGWSDPGAKLDSRWSHPPGGRHERLGDTRGEQLECSGGAGGGQAPGRPGGDRLGASRERLAVEVSGLAGPSSGVCHPPPRLAVRSAERRRPARRGGDVSCGTTTSTGPPGPFVTARLCAAWGRGWTALGLPGRPAPRPGAAGGLRVGRTASGQEWGAQPHPDL